MAITGLSASQRRTDTSTQYPCTLTKYCPMGGTRQSVIDKHMDVARKRWTAGGLLYPCDDCRYICCHEAHKSGHACRPTSRTDPVPDEQDLDLVTAACYFENVLGQISISVNKIPQQYMRYAPQLQHIPTARQVLALQNTDPHQSIGAPQQPPAVPTNSVSRNLASTKAFLNSDYDNVGKTGNRGHRRAKSLAPTRKKRTSVPEILNENGHGWTVSPTYGFNQDGLAAGNHTPYYDETTNLPFNLVGDDKSKYPFPTKAGAWEPPKKPSA
jgi:hypothetical protein